MNGQYSSILRTSVSFSCVFLRFIRSAHSGEGGGTYKKKNINNCHKNQQSLCFIFVFLWSQSHTVVTLGASVYSINSHRLLRAPASTLTTRHEVDSKGDERRGWCSGQGGGGQLDPPSLLIPHSPMYNAVPWTRSFFP